MASTSKVIEGVAKLSVDPKTSPAANPGIAANSRKPPR